jgi:hypothetical protein
VRDDLRVSMRWARRVFSHHAFTGMGLLHR